MPPDIATAPKQPTANPPRDTASKPRKSCLTCGAEGVKNRCGGCRSVYFCNRECQKQVWTVHRPECQQLSSTAIDSSANSAPSEATTAQSTEPSTSKNSSEDTMGGAQSTDVLADAPVTQNDSAPPKKSVVLITEPQVVEVPAVEMEMEMEMATTEKTAPAPSGKAKKKKHKKKKRSNSMHAPASAPMAQQSTPLKGRSQSLSAKKHVVWGEVHAREFTRFPGGGGAVPYDGSWALGLGSPVADVQVGSVLEVEELRLQELEARVKDLAKSKRPHVRDGETRQFDYKSGVRNPLFGRLSERERRKIFSEAELKHVKELEQAQQHEVHHSPMLSSGRRKRSMSSEHSSVHEDVLSLDDADFACVSSEQLDEFAKIRDSRDDACGCSCGDLLKKVAKMNVKKLHAFLAARDVTITSHSKPELLAMAKAIALKEKNCSNSKDCECARNGVPCHSNVCVGCAGDCWNPNKQYSYKKEEVEQYRKEQLAKWKAENFGMEGVTPISVQ